MPYTIACPLCKQTLNVPEEAAGKKVRCPSCQGVFAVAQSAAAITVQPLPAPPPSPAPEPTSAPLKKKNDASNPFDFEAPAKRRRRDEDDEDDDDDDDRRSRRRKKRKRYEDDDDDDLDIADRRRNQSPHRGSMISTFGILGICLCCAPIIGFAFGMAAINMANTDLAAMARGDMDRSGQGATQTGKTCGTIGCVLSGIMLVVAILLNVAGGR